LSGRTKCLKQIKNKVNTDFLSTLILNIETSTTVCSVCLADENQIIDIKETNDGFTHSENLHVFINELLTKNKVSPRELHAVSVSKGPGSYTGLRIGVSAAKGLCYALKIPLMSINTLQSLAAGVVNSKNKEKALYCPMLDARRMEVYFAIYDENQHEITPTRAEIINPETISGFNNFSHIYFFGDGAEKCWPELKKIPGAKIINGISPSSQNMIALSYEAYRGKRFEDIMNFEPLYLKEFFSYPKIK
jgi:tRNA threonylcarbamoyladenosine biosynthesis protein TsaB